MAYVKESTAKMRPSPGHKQSLALRLRRVQGQISGIEKMLQSDRYCVDILIQLRAVVAALKSMEAALFENHLRTCVKAALQSKNETEVDQKIGEIMSLLGKKGQANRGRRPEAKKENKKEHQEGESCVH